MFRTTTQRPSSREESSGDRTESSRWIAPALEALAHTGLMGSPMALSSWAASRFDATGGKPARRG